MTKFEWNDELDVKSPTLNDEHKGLIDKMNDIYESNKRGAEKDEILKLIEDLYVLAENHFKDEEKYMKSIQYPDFEKHKKIHTELLIQLKNHLDGLRENVDQEITDAFFSFLRVWILSHIQCIDMGYAEFSDKK